MKTSVMLVALGLVGLCGCVALPPPSAKPVAPAPTQTLEGEAERKQKLIKKLLVQAEYALVQDQLTVPAEDNAVDRFRAVLLMDTDNAQAISGLQQVVVRYVELAREALAHSQPDLAATYAARASQIQSDNGLLQELDVDIARSLARAAATTSNSSYSLSVTALNQRDASAIPVLEQLALRVKDSGERLLITARDDAEGRWLYQQLRQAAEGYRIRGDIRLGAQPSIIVQSATP